MGPEIALAASARSWPDRMHRFLLDHGGGVVRSRVMGADQAVTDRYDVIFIDDICSFLTPLLVHRIRGLGREIVGVYDPADAPDAKRHLLECGVTDVIEADAEPAEFLAMATSTVAHRSREQPPPAGTPGSFRVGVFGSAGGVGATEIAIGVASSLTRIRNAVLVDLDLDAPSVAQRLDLPVHPNLLTAVDAAHHTPAKLADAVITHESLAVVAGVPTAAVGQTVSPIEVGGLLDQLRGVGHEVVIADLGSRGDRFESLPFHVLIVVGAANPVGITRLVRAVQSTQARATSPDLVAVVNRVPPSPARRSEVKVETGRLIPDVPVVLLPEDRRLERAAWDGSRPVGGPFARAVTSVAALIAGALA